ncbi:MAG: GTP 3',8-cyclase MoaA [Nocardioidaceae bacterium]
MSVVALGMPVTRGWSPDWTPDWTDRPDVPELVDQYGRVARDLRISLTEKCSLRCTYCMPSEGLPAIPHAELLTPDEVARLVRVAAGLGIREVRFTGGEPLVRRDLLEIVRRSAAAAPGLPLSLTSNGVGLDRLAAPLFEAGLTRVNISLDTIDRAEFATLTRRDRLDDVLAGIRAARDAGLAPVKVNAVMMRQTLGSAADLLAWCLRERVELRFIEQMPLDADDRWRRDELVTAADLIETLRARFSLDGPIRAHPSDPAELWVVDGGPAVVGVIASVTRSFCGDCDRTRVTAEGRIRSCLFGDNELDIRAALRGGASDREIEDLWRAATWAKKAGHGIDDPDFVRPLRTMGAIGG